MISASDIQTPSRSWFLSCFLHELLIINVVDIYLWSDKLYNLTFLTMTNTRHFWIVSNAVKTMWKAIFQNKLTICKANLPSFVQKIIKIRCYVDLSRRLRLKSHPKMAAWERLIIVDIHIKLSYNNKGTR